MHNATETERISRPACKIILNLLEYGLHSLPLSYPYFVQAFLRS